MSRCWWRSLRPWEQQQWIRGLLRPPGIVILLEIVLRVTKRLPVQLMVAPLRRLGVNKPTPIDKVGSPESVLSSIGAFITGMCPSVIYPHHFPPSRQKSA